MSKQVRAWLEANGPGGWIDRLRVWLLSAKAALYRHQAAMTRDAFLDLEAALKDGVNPLLDKAMRAIHDNAEQFREFNDSCSISGEDFTVCIFCGADNLEAAKAHRNPPPPTHKPDCVYLDSVAHLKERPDA